MEKIINSSTYKQSSEIKPKQLEKDPDNVYYSRSPRIRYKAETIRDFILASSGLLNYTIGGPSVKPYQPKGVWESTTSGRGVLASYKQDHNSDLYRRGLYTFIKLTAPPPSMMIFDASNRDQCEAKRSSTNTPLQALNMLNDPTILEASRVMAQKISMGAESLDEKIEKPPLSHFLKSLDNLELALKSCQVYWSHFLSACLIQHMQLLKTKL
jgi:hypothetical protein